MTDRLSAIATASICVTAITAAKILAVLTLPICSHPPQRSLKLSGESSVTTFQLPGTRHARNFCATCGSALPLADTKLLVVPADSLDTNIDIAPDGNIFNAIHAAEGIMTST